MHPGDLAASGAPDTQPQSVPRNLVATASGVSQVHLGWTASTDNVEGAGYLVERQDPGSTSFVQVGTSTGTSYNDNEDGVGVGRDHAGGLGFRIGFASRRFYRARFSAAGSA